jgi:hypothetical protein
MNCTDTVESGYASTEELVSGVAEAYAELQMAYKCWAGSQSGKTYEQVLGVLREAHVPESAIPRCKKQSALNLSSSDWNSMTIPVLRSLAPTKVKALKRSFDAAIRFGTESDSLVMMWYMLFFVHPVRHELWYWSCHSPRSYASRLAQTVRSSPHRNMTMAVERLKSDLTDKVFKGCCTAVLRALLLHPTTIKVDIPTCGDDELRRKVSLYWSPGAEELSDGELAAAACLAGRRLDRFDFHKWLYNAQCSINEGPILTLRPHHQHVRCFCEIIEMLGRDNMTDKTMREKLGTHYEEKHEQAGSQTAGLRY